MALFVIGDLHLSGGVDKPMDVFGEQWIGHQEKIQKNWLASVAHGDMVLVPGDISWAMNMNEAMVDLQWIHSMPGSKILLRGNHDYWWSSVTKLNKLFDNMYFLQNNYFVYGDMAICGTRGWICPNENRFTEQDKKIYERELSRLKLSLDSAVNNGHKNIIVMTHYPPTNDTLQPSGFTEIYENYGVKKVVYGHLHDEYSFKGGLQGDIGGVSYVLASCDYLEFRLHKITTNNRIVCKDR